MDEITNTPGWGVPDDFGDYLNNSRYKNRTTLDEMRDFLDVLADEMNQAIPNSTWTELLIYLIESLERKAKDREEFNSPMYGLLEYLSKRVG